MIDFFASVTIALIVAMTVVLYFGNRKQAMILKEMRMVMQDWYQAKMRDRRNTFREQFEIMDPAKWLGDQVNLHIIEQGRKLENPRAVEFFTTEGVRLVVSPLKKGKLRADLRAAEGKRRKVAKLVEPLMGYRPGRVQVIARSNETVHEWFDIEIESAMEKLGIQWGDLNCLYFYLIPQKAIRTNESKVSQVLQETGNKIGKLLTEGKTWIEQRFNKMASG